MVEYDIAERSRRSLVFVSISPLGPRAMDKVFAGGTCEFEAVVDAININNQRASIRITTINCTEPSGTQYWASGYDLGFVAQAPSLGDSTINLDFDGNKYAMKTVDYLIRLKPPIEKLYKYSNK